MKTSSVPDTKSASRAIGIIREVCDKHGVTPQELKGRSRRSKCIPARVECASRLMDELCMSAAAIARIMLKDHTTILYYFKKKSYEGSAQGFSGYFLASIPNAAIINLSASSKEILRRKP